MEKTFEFKISDDMYRRLKNLAEQQERSAASVLREALRRYLDEQTKS